jgi:protein TonB
MDNRPREGKERHGSVSRVSVLQSVPLLDAAAMDAVRQWRFIPTLLNDVPVPVVMTITVAFSVR